jgi:replicative DNA helicase
LLSPEMFTVSFCGAIFDRMAELYQAGQTWSMATIKQDFQARNKGNMPPNLLSEMAAMMCDCCGMVFKLRADVQRVRDVYAIRQLQTSGVEMSKAWEPGASLSDVLGTSQLTFERVQEMLATGGGPTHATQVLAELKAELAAGKTPKGVRTSLPKFDHMTGGLYLSTLYVFGARPSTGKTALAVTLAIEAAKEGVQVLFCSTETTKRITGARIAGYLTKVDAYRFKSGSATVAQAEEAEKKMPATLELFDETPELGAFLAQIARWRKSRVGPAMVIVDYLEQVQPPRGRESREQQISGIIDALHKAGKRHNVIMVVLSQLARRATEKKDGPTMDDLRFSGMIEQAADLIGLMYRNDPEGDAITLKVAKNKVSGQEFDVDLVLNKGQSRMSECADVERSAPWDKRDWNG